jgi:hypothetical protein
MTHFGGQNPNPHDPFHSARPESWWKRLTGPQAAVLGVSIWVLAPVVLVVLTCIGCCAFTMIGGALGGATHS